MICPLHDIGLLRPPNKDNKTDKAHSRPKFGEMRIAEE
jgi:hypothetical protein